VIGRLSKVSDRLGHIAGTAGWASGTSSHTLGITLGWAVRAKFKSRLITDEDEVAIFVG
jgi:hypothetical protein